MRKQTAYILKKVGVPPQKTGYDYIGDAVEMIHEDRRNLKGITRKLYPAIAEKYGTTKTAVEAAIRHAIEASMNNLGIREVEEIFGSTISYAKDKPTNACFLAVVAEMLEDENDG